MKVKARDGGMKKRLILYYVCHGKHKSYFKFFLRESILSVLSFMKIKVFPLDTETTSGILFF